MKKRDASQILYENKTWQSNLQASNNAAHLTRHCDRAMLKKRLRWFIARGLHLFPFRTEKLNLVAPMVLRKRESRSPPPSEESLTDTIRGAFSFLGEMGGSGEMGGLGMMGSLRIMGSTGGLRMMGNPGELSNPGKQNPISPIRLISLQCRAQIGRNRILSGLQGQICGGNL